MEKHLKGQSEQLKTRTFKENDLSADLNCTAVTNPELPVKLGM